jgi:hypothetical protein
MHILKKGAAYPSDAVGFCLDLQNTKEQTKQCPKEKDKRTNNDIQNATLKTKDRATQIPLNSAVPDG